MRIIKRIGKTMVKVVVLPVWILALLLKWVTIFAVSCSVWFFRILAVILFVTAVLGHFMGLEEMSATITMLVTSFVIFIVPYIAAWVAGTVDAGCVALKKFMKS